MSVDQQDVVSRSHDLILPQCGELAEAVHPGHDFDLVSRERRLPIFDLMRPHDKDRSGREVAFLRPTLRGGVLDGRVLQPTQVLDVADVTLIVDLVRLNRA